VVSIQRNARNEQRQESPLRLLLSCRCVRCVRCVRWKPSLTRRVHGAIVVAIVAATFSATVLAATALLYPCNIVVIIIISNRRGLNLCRYFPVRHTSSFFEGGTAVFVVLFCLFLLQWRYAMHFRGLRCLKNTKLRSTRCVSLSQAPNAPELECSASVYYSVNSSKRSSQLL